MIRPIGATLWQRRSLIRFVAVRTALTCFLGAHWFAPWAIWTAFHRQTRCAHPATQKWHARARSLRQNAPPAGTFLHIAHKSLQPLESLHFFRVPHFRAIQSCPQNCNRFVISFQRNRKWMPVLPAQRKRKTCRIRKSAGRPMHHFRNQGQRLAASWARDSPITIKKRNRADSRS